MRRTLDIWPPLPIVIDHLSPSLWDVPGEVDDIVAALERNDRVCNIYLKGVARSPLQIILAKMHVSFPALTHLKLLSEFGVSESAVVPDSFLGGSAPRLRSLSLGRIPFPGLPKLLLSATNLVYLSLSNVPRSGYISPEAMATCLSTLTRLNSLGIDFQFDFRPPPDQESRRPPPPTRSVLPALKTFYFGGFSEYLEDLVARIDTPRLFEYWRFNFLFLHQIILDTPQLAQFLTRIPKLKTCKEAQAILFDGTVAVRLYLPFTRARRLFLSTACTGNALVLQLLFLAQVCRSSLSLLPSLKHFGIIDGSGVSRQKGPDDFEINQWLEILLPFATAENLYLSKKIVPRIAPALELVGESPTEVLPSLQSLFLQMPYPSGSVEDAIGKFVSARQLSGRPIVVHDWDGRSWSGPRQVDVDD